MAKDGHPTTAAAFGIAYLLVAVALLLQEFGLLTLRWSVVAPLILLAVGLVLAISGVAGAHRTRPPRS